MRLKSINLEKELLKDQDRFSFKNSTYDKYLLEMKDLMTHMKTTNVAPTESEMQSTYPTIFMIIKNHYRSKGAFLNRYIGHNWVFSTNRGSKCKALERVEDFLRKEDHIISLKSGKEVCFLTKTQIIEKINFSTFNIKDLSKKTNILFITNSLKPIVLAINDAAKKDMVSKEDLIAINRTCVRDFKEKKNTAYLTIKNNFQDIFGLAQLLGFRIK